MKRSILIICLQFFILLSANSSFSQTLNNDLNTLKKKARMWDGAFNRRDTTTYFDIVNDRITIAAGGGIVIGLEELKFGTISLFRDRPDITLYMHPLVFG